MCWKVNSRVFDGAAEYYVEKDGITKGVFDCQLYAERFADYLNEKEKNEIRS